MRTYSVLIRTYNSENTLDGCLLSVFAQSIPPLQILVVDNQSTDSTLDIANKHRCKILQYPSNESFNYSKSLNIGISALQSDYVLILSSHCELLDRFSVRKMLDLFEKYNELAGVSLIRSPKRDIDHSQSTSSWKMSSKINFDGQALFNFCSMIPRKLWIEYPFNEHIPSAEDQDWAKYFIMKYNMFTIIDFGTSVFYNNRYYNYKKDIRDYLVISKYIDPRWSSGKTVFSLFYDLILLIIKLRLKESAIKLSLIILIFYFKLTGKIYKNHFIKK